jgi:hypothetical protein
VARRVHVEHRLARLDLVGIQILQRRAAELGGVDAHVAVDLADVVVPRDRIEAGPVRLGVEVDGVLMTQRAKPLVGNAVDERVVIGEVDLLQRAHR